MVLDLREGEGMAMAAAAYGSRRERRGSHAGDEWCAGRVGGCGWVRGWTLDPSAMDGSDFIERGDPRERS